MLSREKAEKWKYVVVFFIIIFSLKSDVILYPFKLTWDLFLAHFLYHKSGHLKEKMKNKCLF